MEGSKEFFLKVREEEYLDLPPKLRMRAEARYNDYHLYKDDDVFKKLYARLKKARDDLRNYKFDKRHNQR